MGDTGIRNAGHGVRTCVVPLGHLFAAAVAHLLHVDSFVGAGGITVVDPQERADLHILAGSRRSSYLFRGDDDNLSGAQLFVILIAQIQIGIAFKSNAVSIFLFADDDRGPAHTVSGRIDPLGRHQHQRHGTVDDFLGIPDAVDQIFFLIDNGSDQFCGINIPSAHFQKMSIAVLIDQIGDFFCVVDFANGGDGVGTVVRADDQGLRFIIGDTTDTHIPFHLPHIFVKFGAKRCVFYIVNRAVKAVFAVYRHAASPCTKVRMIVCPKKQVKDAVIL